MTRYDDEPRMERSAVSLDDLLNRDPRPDGTEIALAALSTVLSDWEPAERMEALNTIAADLADGGSIAVSYASDDEEYRR